ncbi:hypothetical protein Q3W71_24105 [Micromonospora sp. C28SCA-DRY-2]|uniref:hypothetical protein n=1 Tax=Micromonospora sp. C28SCA-DRY-2 TaxID=3059522 RepID=UPI0026773989|nr:hypothetical protein [Micromonospora sp. C28SCA-DRY-2]MDO3704751.1 hypothetical protein [Micromonospora sp. C28SCA-DRY-2]
MTGRTGPARAAGRGAARRRRAPAATPAAPPDAVTPGAARRLLNRDQEAIRRVLDGGPDRVRRGPGGLRRGLVRRRRTALLALAVVATVSAAALVVGLLSWAPDPPEQPRTLTAAEHERLAAMRVTNYRDLRSGLHVTTGEGAARTELIGWVDWSRPLVYLDVGGPGAGAERGLLQATPTVVLLRPDPTAVPTPAPPPLVPPADRWRLHDLPAGHGLARLLDLLFRLAADRPEPAGPDAARWVGRDTVGAEPVDILQAPAPGGVTTAEHPRYWLDQSARLHRLKTRLSGVGPVTVQLNRTNRPTLRPVDALGGRPGLPRALTAAEQDRLDRLAGRLRDRGGATVTLTAPVGADTNLRGIGWLSWARRSAYLTVADLNRPDRRTLLHHGPAGTARADLPATAVPGPAEKPGRPPLPSPTGGWRAGPARADDLDLLVDAALRAGGPTGQRGDAVRVRGDSLDGRTVDVIEVRTSRTLLRYWIDRSGLLRRLELRTRPGAWAQLDLTPAPVPGWTAPAPGRTRAADR